MVVKLHPAHYRTDVPKRLRDLGFALCSNEDFVNRLKGAFAALSEPSSAAVIPCLLGLPLLMAEYGKLSGQRYGAVLTGYPMAAPLRDLTEAVHILEELCKTTNRDDVLAWIKRSSGPLPAENMPNRVVNVIHSICSHADKVF